MIYRTEKYVLNFFFGKVFTQPISFRYVFNGLKDIYNESVDIKFNLKNSPELFPNENKFLQFNSLTNRQEIGHNFHAAVHTGIIEAIYPPFQVEDTYLYNETINIFLQKFITYLLTFFQRRRVVMGILNFSCDKMIFTFPPFFAGELIDSVGYGEPLIPYDKTDACLSKSLKTYEKMDDLNKEILEGLLVRYNETLNLPYTYERAEAYWRIIESLSDDNLDNIVQGEYNRLKILIGVDKSRNLKKFVKTILSYKIKYSDQDIIDAFNFRNNSFHEYLNIRKIVGLSVPFLFMNKCVEEIIISLLQINKSDYIEPSYTIIQDRVL